MPLRRLLHKLMHGDQRSQPRTPDAFAALIRKRTVEQRVQRLETDLRTHLRKPPYPS